MPPLIVWALGAVGAVVVGRWIAERARRWNAELGARQDVGRRAAHAEPDRGPRLERDPATGIYRPK
jgi:hypothetical protein